MSDVLLNSYNIGNDNVKTAIYDYKHTDEAGRTSNYLDYLKEKQQNFEEEKRTKDKKAFLMLFTALVKHQNPLQDKLDINQMFNPIYQLNTMEHMSVLVDKVNKLTEIVENNLTSNLEDRFAGKYVEISDDEIELNANPEGQIQPKEISYKLNDDAYNMNINITNEKGKLIFSKTISRDSTESEGEYLDKGEHNWQWSGKDDGGNFVLPGSYNVRITYEKAEKKELRDSNGNLMRDDAGNLKFSYSPTNETYGEDGKRLEAEIFKRAIAHSASKENNNLFVEVNGKKYGLDKVKPIDQKSQEPGFDEKTMDKINLAKLMNSIKSLDLSNGQNFNTDNIVDNLT